MTSSADSPDCEFGSGDFTVERRARPSSIAAVGTILTKRASDSCYMKDGMKGEFFINWSVAMNELDIKPALMGRMKRKLKMEDVALIRASLLIGGVTMTELARKFEISRPCIGKILSNKTYREAQP